MILDTSFIIDLMREDSGAVKKLKEIEGNVIAKITPITSFELYYGAKKYHSTQEEVQKIRKALEGMNKISIKWEDGSRAAEIFYSLEKEGKNIEFTDILIASIALNRNEKILTGNKRHFEKVKGLEVESY